MHCQHPLEDHPTDVEPDRLPRGILGLLGQRSEVSRIWVSIYSPQVGERTAEMLSAEDRGVLAEQLLRLRERNPKFLMNEGMARALLSPPQTPRQCLFSKMSTNYTADLETYVEPCILGGEPDCGQSGWQPPVWACIFRGSESPLACCCRRECAWATAPK